MTNEAETTLKPIEVVKPPVRIVVPTPQQATIHFQNQLFGWFNKFKPMKYDFNYGPPGNDYIQSLLLETEFGINDPVRFKKEVETIYGGFDFSSPRNEIVHSLPLVEQALDRFEKCQKQWAFKMFPEYNIELVIATIGGGGSWQTDHDGKPNGVVTYWRNPKRSPKDRSTAERIAHEIGHTGIEENIVSKYQLEQKTNERLVDLWLKILLRDIFPDYHLQQGLDTRIDPFITENTIDDLPNAVSRFIKSLSS